MTPLSWQVTGPTAITTTPRAASSTTTTTRRFILGKGTIYKQEVTSHWFLKTEARDHIHKPSWQYSQECCIFFRRSWNYKTILSADFSAIISINYLGRLDVSIEWMYFLVQINMQQCWILHSHQRARGLVLGEVHKSFLFTEIFPYHLPYNSWLNSWLNSSSIYMCSNHQLYDSSWLIFGLDHVWCDWSMSLKSVTGLAEVWYLVKVT